MQSIFTTLFAGLIFFTSSVLASNYEYKRLQKEIEPYLATKRPYPVPAPSEQTSAPRNCKLVHINYLGRHGSRQITSMGDVLSDIINPAIRLGLVSSLNSQSLTVSDNLGLTPLGKILAERLITLHRNYSLDIVVPGQLTQQGIQEQADLGRRLFDNTGLSPKQVKQQISLRSLYAQSTATTRTQESRKAFLDGLASSLETRPESLKVIYDTPTSQEVDRTLHFYDHCKTYLDAKKSVKKASKKHIARLESDTRYHEAARALARAFITPSDNGTNFDQQAIELGNLVYSLCQLDANMSYTMGICPLFFQMKMPFADYLKDKNHFANVKQFYKRGMPVELGSLNRDMTV